MARCTKCPNATHSWEHCFFDPRNPKNKLKDKNFMSRHGNQNKGNQFQNGQQQQQGFATQQMQPQAQPPPPPNYQGVYSNQSQINNQGPPSSVSIQSGQSYSNDQGGRWSTVWIPS